MSLNLKPILFSLALSLWIKTPFAQVWSPPVRVSPESMEVSSVKLAVDHQGKVWCVWDLLSYPRYNPVLATYYENGVWSKPDTVMPDTIEIWPGTVDIAVDKNGNLWVVANDFYVFAVYFDGEKWSRIITVDKSGWAPHCTADSSGNLWIVWTRFWTIYSCYYNGDEWSKIMPVSHKDFDCSPSSMTTDKYGRVWCLWGGPSWYVDSACIWVNFYDGRQWSEPTLLAWARTTSSFIHGGGMTCDRNGLVWASWYKMQDTVGARLSHTSTAYNIYTAYYDTVWSNPILVTTTPSYTWIFPVMASDAHNRVWLAWSAMPQGTSFVYYSIWDGSTWSEPALVDTLQGYHRPAIAYDPYRDRIWVAWLSRREGYSAVYVSYTQATGVEEKSETNLKFQTPQLQVSPNPFNQVMQIHCTLPRSSKVLIRIYDISGKLIKTLANGNMKAGSHILTWDGKDEFGKNVPAGIYFLRMETSGYKATRKLLLMH